MVRHFGIFIVTLALLLPGCAKEDHAREHRDASDQNTQAQAVSIGLWPLADTTVTGLDATELPLDELALAPEPALAEGDIVFYDQPSCLLYVRVGRPRPISESMSRDYPVPAVVTVDGERRFLCGLPGRDIYRALRGPRADGLPVAFRGSGEIHAFALQSPWDGPDGMDPRDDPAFLDALRQTGKLDPAVLLPPRMKREEVIAAALAAGVRYPWSSAEPEPVPETWTIASVTFCREVPFTEPSVNIIGLTGPHLAFLAWVVKFDASADPRYDSARRRQPACLISDATGDARTINPPLLVKSLDVPGSDTLPTAPLADEQDIRQLAGDWLAVITRVEFCESVEAIRSREASYPTWRRYTHVWVCDGEDGLANPTTVIITDGTPGYEGPRNLFVGDTRFELRRIVPLRQPTGAQQGQ